jgi:hypothetical protein
VRLVEVAAIVVFLAGCGAIARAAWRAATAPRAADAGDWQPYHRYEGTCRRVYVRRGAELEPVGEIASSDPDYDTAFLRLMDRARERAATLNSER